MPAEPLVQRARHPAPAQRLIQAIDGALRVLTGQATAARPYPAQAAADNALSDPERRLSAALIRVDHVGEVCAQALYHAQGQFARTDAIRAQMAHAGREEEDHLDWTARRLQELGSRPSLLNPLWYTGAYCLGTLAALVGDRRSLGFVVETERQVEAHLALHLQLLPAQDVRSRAVVEQMRIDEQRHGAAAQAMGAQKTALPVRLAMHVMGRLMTGTAYYV